MTFDDIFIIFIGIVALLFLALAWLSELKQLKQAERRELVDQAEERVRTLLRGLEATLTSGKPGSGA